MNKMEIEKVIEQIGIATFGGVSFEPTSVYREKLTNILNAYGDNLLREEVLKDPCKQLVEELNLSSKIKWVLTGNRVKTVGGLIRQRERDILAMDGMGPKGLKVIVDLLKEINLELRKD